MRATRTLKWMGRVQRGMAVAAWLAMGGVSVAALVTGDPVLAALVPLTMLAFFSAWMCCD